jgi:hypothetical protein
MFGTAYRRIKYAIQYRFWYSLFLASAFTFISYAICPQHPYMLGLGLVALVYAYENR